MVRVAVIGVGAVLLMVIFAWFATRRSAAPPGMTLEQSRAEYARLKALPLVAHDFTTPEGAILMLEDAYRKRDIEAAIAAKDFDVEARLMLSKLKTPTDDALVKETAETLKLSFRKYTTTDWPDFEGIECFFTGREPYAEKVVIVTEVCRFPDEGFSTQKMLVAETPNGWRVLNPLD